MKTIYHKISIGVLCLLLSTTFIFAQPHIEAEYLPEGVYLEEIEEDVHQMYQQTFEWMNQEKAKRKEQRDRAIEVTEEARRHLKSKVKDNETYKRYWDETKEIERSPYDRKEKEERKKEVEERYADFFREVMQDIDTERLKHRLQDIYGEGCTIDQNLNVTCFNSTKKKREGEELTKMKINKLAINFVDLTTRGNYELKDAQNYDSGTMQMQAFAKMNSHTTKYFASQGQVLQVPPNVKKVRLTVHMGALAFAQAKAFLNTSNAKITYSVSIKGPNNFYKTEKMVEIEANAFLFGGEDSKYNQHIYGYMDFIPDSSGGNYIIAANAWGSAWSMGNANGNIASKLEFQSIDYRFIY